MGTIIYKVATEEMRAAMRRALEKALDGVDVSDDALNAIADAIEGFDEALEHVMANPCACPAGARCTYRGLPPSDPDTGHCEQCGAFMPDDETIAVGDRRACPGCGTEYVVGEPEDDHG